MDSRTSRRRWVVLATVLAGLFSINVTFTVFVVALPQVAGQLHTSVPTLTWVVTGPLLAFGVAAPLLGKVGDLWGHRRLYLAGLAGGAVCAIASAAAPDAAALIVARTLEGLEGAATGAASMALIFTIFGPEERAKAMGWWSLVGAGGPVIGVTLGAPVIQYLGWRWLFVGQLPLSLSALAVAAVVLPRSRPQVAERLDWRGALALIASVGAGLFGLNRGPAWGWASPGVLGAFAVTGLAGWAFVAIERRVAAPLLPLHYLRRRNFTFPIATLALGNFAYMGGLFLAPLLLEEVFHQSPSHAGLVVIARPLAFSLSAPVAGHLAVRLGERASAVAGAAALAGSMLLFASLGAGSADLVILGALALSGVGMGVASPALAASVGNAVEQTSLGVASAAQQLMAQVGTVAGIQVMVTVQAVTARSAGLVGSFADAYLVGALGCVVAVVCGSLVRSSRPSRPQPPAPVEEPVAPVLTSAGSTG